MFVDKQNQTQRKPRILVIEDEKYLRELYRQYLCEKYDVHFAADGMEGYCMGATKPFDLVITDLNMPAWSGCDAINTISHFRPGSKFIVVSGFLADENFAKTLANSKNIEFVFAKPVKKEALLEAVEKVLSTPVTPPPPVASVNVRPKQIPPLKATHGRGGPHHNPPISRRKLWGLGGALALLLGAFLPALSTSDGHYISFIRLAPADAWLVATLAFAGCILALFRQYSTLLMIATVCLFLVCFEFINLQISLSDLRTTPDADWAKGSTAHYGRFPRASSFFNWGWTAMLVGTVMMGYAGLRPSRKRGTRFARNYGDFAGTRSHHSAYSTSFADACLAAKPLWTPAKNTLAI